MSRAVSAVKEFFDLRFEPCCAKLLAQPQVEAFQPTFHLDRRIHPTTTVLIAPCTLSLMMQGGEIVSDISVCPHCNARLYLMLRRRPDPTTP